MQGKIAVVAVVEDDPGFLAATENLLDAYGFSATGFASASKFLDRDSLVQFDCLLLDINLGGMSGLELCLQLKTTGSKLPVIIMTALDSEAIRERALEAGCVAFLRKPFPTSTLIDAISKILA